MACRPHPWEEGICIDVHIVGSREVTFGGPEVRPRVHTARDQWAGSLEDVVYLPWFTRQTALQTGWGWDCSRGLGSWARGKTAPGKKLYRAVTRVDQECVSCRAACGVRRAACWTLL